MASRPFIGVTTSITVDEGPERAYVNSAYLDSVQQAGGVPLPLPPQLSGSALEILMSRVDGLLLTGGGDIDPALFGEAPHPTVHEVAPARDSLEMSAIRLGLERSLPILAICRGIQILNVALGGSLYQDVGSDPGTQLRHSQEEPRDHPTHKVKLVPGSRLARVLEVDEVEVNSMHHQAVKDVARGLVAVGWAPDQVIEAVESEDAARFVLAVQWHPEELVGHSEPARRLFAGFIAAARSSQGTPAP